ncbi:nitroreductase family protein [Amycolatopsis sp. NPDC005232]|uniref:nitroreductase family protein n=1 Tax=Amycolatopsis sp. NPDC005232 TaxID=3157027 RepID=UPI0033BEB0F2
MVVPTAGLADVSLREVWTSMAVVSEAQEFRRVPKVGEGFARALRIVHDALLGPSGGAGRPVPSAGAIFPYDVLVLTDEPGSAPGLFRVDAVRRACVRLLLPAPALRAVVQAMPRAAGVTRDVWAILLSRPWLSVRKYGPRGYLYAQLDTGHAATSLLGGALATGPAELHLKLARRQIQKALWGLLPFREPHSVLAIGPAPVEAGPDPLPVVEPLHAVRTDSHGDLERFGWAMLPDGLATGADTRGTSAAAPTSVVPGAEPGIPAGDWLRWTRARRSCNQFRARPVAGSALSDALGALGTRLVTDLDDAPSELRLTLVVTTDEVAAACRAAWRGTGVDVVVSAPADDPDHIRRLCMGQRHLGGAKAFLVCHVDGRTTLGLGSTQVFREALFRAAAAAHLVYLGAARAGVAVTSVGGYDIDGWRLLAGLGPDDEPVYLMALGEDGAGRIKQDRAAIAYAHGE